MNGQTTIYALADPNSGEVRYIGKTVRPVNRRLTGHICDAARGRNHRCNWIRSLGQPPSLRVLMVVPNDMSAAAEVYAIALYRLLGYRLTNESDGGEGAPGAKRSDEFKQKIRTYQTGKPKKPEAIEKTRQANIGKKLSPEHCQKIGASKKGNKFWVGKHHKEETKEKIRRFILSKTHCSKGHEYTTQNTRWTAKGWRVCRACARGLERVRRATATRRKDW